MAEDLPAPPPSNAEEVQQYARRAPHHGILGETVEIHEVDGTRHAALEELHQALSLPMLERAQAREAFRRSSILHGNPWPRGLTEAEYETVVSTIEWALFADSVDTPPPDHQDLLGFIAEHDTTFAYVFYRDVKHNPQALNILEKTVPGKAVRTAASHVLETHPDFIALKAIGDKPMNEEHKTPLTLFEVEVALAQEEQIARRAHGLDPKESLRFHPRLTQQLARKRQQLEEETLPRPSAEYRDTPDPLRQAQEFIINTAAVRRDNPPEGVINAEEYFALLNYPGLYESELRQVLSFSLAYDKSAAGQAEARQSLRLQLMSTETELNALRHGFLYLPVSPHISKLDYSSLLSLNVGRQTSTYLSGARVIMERLLATRSLSQLAGFSNGTHIESPFGGSSSSPDRRGAYQTAGLAQFSSPESYTLDLDTVEETWFGQVMYCDVPPIIGQKLRILSPYHSGHEPPYDYLSTTLAPGSDMSVTMAPNQPRNFTIPGFRTVCIRGQSIDFVYDANDDPRLPCKIEVPTGGIAVLEAVWRKAGLESMADKLKDVRTVRQLELVIQHSSDYVVKATGRASTDSIEDLAAAYLKPDGRLGLQCTGANHLLKSSLDIAFGNGLAAVFEGTAIQARAGDKLSSIGHAQVKFISPDTGKIYHLDATPSMPGEQIEQMYADEFQIAKPTAGELSETPRQRKHNQMTKEAQQAQIMSITEGQLFPDICRWAGLPVGKATSRDRLLEWGATRSKHDPIYRTLSLAIRSQHGNATHEDALELRHYLTLAAKRLQDSSHLKKQLGLEGYDQSKITRLNQAVSELARILPKRNT